MAFIASSRKIRSIRFVLCNQFFCLVTKIVGPGRRNVLRKSGAQDRMCFLFPAQKVSEIAHVYHDIGKIEGKKSENRPKTVVFTTSDIKGF